jgi:hypothetical protein
LTFNSRNDVENFLLTCMYFVVILKKVFHFLGVKRCYAATTNHHK